jgi:hypothetical protein
MSARAVRIAVTIVRMWTRLYTWRLPQSVRNRRRAEIESDLWESQRDANASSVTLGLVVRLLLGIVDDVRWRVEQVSAAPPRRRVVAVSVGAGVLIACVLLGVATRSVNPPPPPHAPDLDWRHRNRPAPPPPPPPPPPCNPPGIGRPAFSPCTPY